VCSPLLFCILWDRHCEPHSRIVIARGLPRSNPVLRVWFPWINCASLVFLLAARHSPNKFGSALAPQRRLPRRSAPRKDVLYPSLCLPQATLRSPGGYEDSTLRALHPHTLQSRCASSSHHVGANLCVRPDKPTTPCWPNAVQTKHSGACSFGRSLFSTWRSVRPRHPLSRYRIGRLFNGVFWRFFSFSLMIGVIIFQESANG